MISYVLPTRDRPAILARHIACGAQLVLDIPAGGIGEVVLQVPAPERGWLALGRVMLETRFPLGLFRAWSYIERRKPAEFHRHVVTVAQLRAFLDLLPDWEQIAVGVRAIVLASDTDCYGWYQAGTVAICNWQHDLWSVEPPSFFDEALGR